MLEWCHNSSILKQKYKGWFQVMGITETVKKQALIASGNQCYHPDCSEFIFNLDDEVILGEVAHIEGEKPKSARYNEYQSKDERNSFPNLITLCPNHHTLIDKAPDKYPKEILFSWKKEHEEKITNTLDKNWISPPNSITRLDKNGEKLHLNYWIDQNGKPKLYTNEQLVVCSALRRLSMLNHGVNDILNSINQVEDISQIGWLKSQVEKLNMNQYGIFGTLQELHLLAKDVSFLDYELFITQGFRSQKSSLLEMSNKLLSEYETNVSQNTGNETDLYEELKKFTLTKDEIVKK